MLGIVLAILLLAVPTAMAQSDNGQQQCEQTLRQVRQYGSVVATARHQLELDLAIARDQIAALQRENAELKKKSEGEEKK